MEEWGQKPDGREWEENETTSVKKLWQNFVVKGRNKAVG